LFRRSIRDSNNLVLDRRRSRQGRVARYADAHGKGVRGLFLRIRRGSTAQIANTIDAVLKLHGVGVVIKATHHCIAGRGVKKSGVGLMTRRMLGCFRDNALTRQEFLSMVNSDRQ
jgi:GTP cyclohydrolase I